MEQRCVSLGKQCLPLKKTSASFCLLVMLLYDPVNTFSVMSGRFPVFLSCAVPEGGGGAGGPDPLPENHKNWIP